MILGLGLWTIIRHLIPLPIVTLPTSDGQRTKLIQHIFAMRGKLPKLNTVQRYLAIVFDDRKWFETWSMASQNGRRPGYLRSANQNHQNFPALCYVTHTHIRRSSVGFDGRFYHQKPNWLVVNKQTAAESTQIPLHVMVTSLEPRLTSPLIQLVFTF